MEHTTYRVNVTSPGQTLFFRGRVVRTPVVFENVYEKELDIVALQLKQKSISYNVEKNSGEVKLSDDLADTVIEENPEVKVEELYPVKENKPKSILDKLIAEN